MIKIYGRENCIYCTKAKELAESLSLDFDYVDMTNWDSKDLMALLKEARMTTVPVIFDEYEELIGGYNSFRMWLTK